MPNIPLIQFINDGDTLYRWLGMFWTELYQDRDFMRGAQGGRALLAAQAYLDLLEASALLDRRQAPVLHRERWYPIVVRRSEQGLGEAAALTLGMEPTPVLGPQTDPAFKAGAEFTLNGAASFAGIVTYPLASAPDHVMTCITDNIAAPKRILVRDRDFVIQDGALVLRTQDDPFAADSDFAVDGDEAVLWGCDVMFDRDYVYEHIGYVFGIRTGSTEYFKRVLNAVWDLTTAGASPALFTSMLAAICGIPVAGRAGEIVEDVCYDGDPVSVNTDILVITDADVYRFPPTALITVKPGDVLAAGQLMDSALKLYFGVTDVRGGTDLRNDIPVVTLPPGCLKAATDYGLSLGWEPAPIYYAGDDSNGNAKLWFPVSGSDRDVASFWNSAWAACESAGTPIEACFAGLIDGTVSRQQGAVCGSVEPLGFFLRNLIGANTLLVALNVSQLRQGVRQQVLPLFVTLMNATLPAYVRMFLVERRTVPACDYDFAASTEAGQARSYVSSSKSSTARAGGPTPIRMTYKDRKPTVRWTATCK